MTSFQSLLDGARIQTQHAKMEDASASLLYDVAAGRNKARDASLVLALNLREETQLKLWSRPETARMAFNEPAEFTSQISSALPLEVLVKFTLKLAQLCSKEIKDDSLTLLKMSYGSILASLSRSSQSENTFESDLTELAKILMLPPVTKSLLELGSGNDNSALARFAFASPGAQEWFEETLKIFDLNNISHVRRLSNLLSSSPPRWALRKLPWSAFEKLDSLRSSTPWSVIAIDLVASELHSAESRATFAGLMDNWSGTVEELLVACHAL